MMCFMWGRRVGTQWCDSKTERGHVKRIDTIASGNPFYPMCSHLPCLCSPVPLSKGGLLRPGSTFFVLPPRPMDIYGKNIAVIG